MLESINLEHALLGKLGAERELEKLRLAGATEEQIKGVLAKLEAIQAYDGAAKASKGFQKELNKEADAAKQAAEAVAGMWAALSKETATLGFDEVEKRVYDLAEQMRAAGESQAAVEAKTAEYEAQLRLNDEFEQQLKIEDELEQASADKLKKSGEFINDLEEQQKLLNMASDAERERYTALKGIAPELREQAEALYDQIRAQEKLAAEVQQIWEGVADGLISAFTGFGQVLTGNVADMRSGAGSMAASLQSAYTARGLSSAAGAFGLTDLAASLGKQGMIGGVSDEAITKALGGMGTFGEGLNGLIDGVGGMTNAVGLASAGLSLLAGDTKGAISGALGVGATAAINLIPGAQVIAPIVGPIVGQLLGGLFGGGGRTQTGVGISGALVGGAVTGGEFSDTNGARSFTLEQSNRKGTVGRYGHDAALELESEVGRFSTDLRTRVEALGEFFGQDLLPAFDEKFNFAFDFEAKTPEELAQKLSKMYADASSEAFEIAGEAIDTSALTGGKKAFVELWSEVSYSAEALPTLLTGFNSLSNSLEMMGIPLDSITADLIEATGGLDSYAGSLAFFTDQFFSESEKFAFSEQKLTSALSDLGLQLPTTRAEFRELYQSTIDLGEAGAETAGKLNGLLGEIDAHYDKQEQGIRDVKKSDDSYWDAMEQAQSAAARAAQENADAHRKAAEKIIQAGESINDWLFSQATGGDSALTFGEQFAIAQAEFSRVQAEAFAGNADAAGRLTSVADTLLELNRQGYGAAGAGFEAGVRAQVGAVAQKFGGGTSPVFTAPQMPILPQQQQPGAPVVNVTNNNAELIQLLRALLEAERNGSIDVVAGLTKIERAIGARERVRA
jgi:hypothetical protein